MFDTSNQPIRLLQVASALATSPHSGAELRVFHLALGLARHMDVTHVGFAAAHDARETEIGGARFIPVRRDRAYRRFDLIRGALGPVPFPVLNYSRAEMNEMLSRILASARHEIVLLESIHLAGYLPLLRPAGDRRRLIVCDWHNIESELLAQRGRTEAGLAGRIYIRRQAALLEKYERWFLNQCDAHIVVSEPDRQTLNRYGVTAPVFVIGNGVEVRHFSGLDGDPGYSASRNRVLFVGSMDYHPNVEAVRHFTSEIWPQIRQGLPGAVFTIVGRNPAPAVCALTAHAGIEVTGSVPDVRPYYRQAFVAVVPLLVGGGTRLKILEAMAAGLPVVSTALGAEGLAAVPEKHYYQANTPAAMSTAVLEVARGGDRLARLTAAASELVKQEYEWSALASALSSNLLAMLQPARSRTATA
jgi:glycosyltransferase involved in cell wall biosynthesis